MKNLLWVILFMICIWIVYSTSEPENLRVLKSKYIEFIKDLPHEFKHLSSRSIISGTTRRDELGSNVNKGYEISICLDNNINSMFHVLLHELAHCTVEEYEHSNDFWNKYERLKDHAIERGFYSPIKDPIDFCGNKIND